MAQKHQIGKTKVQKEEEKVGRKVFKLGDQVMMGDEHWWIGGRYYDEADPGAIGIITHRTRDHRAKGGWYYGVEWTPNPKAHCVDSQIDHDCLKPLVRPVTAKQLEYVYKSLGVPTP